MKAKKEQTVGEGMMEIIRHLPYQPYKAFSKRLRELVRDDEQERLERCLWALGYHTLHSENEKSQALMRNLIELRVDSSMRERWSRFIDIGKWD